MVIIKGLINRVCKKVVESFPPPVDGLWFEILWPVWKVWDNSPPLKPGSLLSRINIASQCSFSLAAFLKQ